MLSFFLCSLAVFSCAFEVALEECFTDFDGVVQVEDQLPSVEE
jgi:hypothetical protein